MADATGARQNLTRRARASHRAATRQMAKDAATAAPKDTRQLERSIRVVGDRFAGGVASAMIEVNPPRSPASPDNVDVAGFNEHGTRPHVIKPRRPGGKLVFQVGGRTLVRASVHHPGQPARPWWAPTLKRWPQAIQQAWRSSR